MHIVDIGTYQRSLEMATTSDSGPTPPGRPRRPGWLGLRARGTVLQQIGTLGAGRIAAAGLSAAWLVMAARILSPHSFGDLTLLLSTGYVAGVVGDMGLQMALARHTAETQRLDWDMVRRTIHRRLVLVATVGVPLSFFYLAAASQRTVVVPLIFVGSLLGTAVYSSDTVALNTLGHTHVDAANEALSRLFVLGVGVLWLLHGGGLLAAVSVYAAADVCSAVVVSLLTCRYDHLQAAAPAAPAPAVVPGSAPPSLQLRRTAPLALALLSATLYAHVDVWILAVVRGTAVSGHYAAADRILSGILLLPSAVASVAMGKVGPRTGSDRWRTAMGYAGGSVVIAAVPAVTVAAVAHPLMRDLFGPHFAAVAPTLVLLVASALPGAAICVLSPLTAMTTGSRYLWCVMVGLVLNVVLNLLLIPGHATVGAAVANLISESVLCLSLCVATRMTCSRPRHADHRLPVPVAAAEPAGEERRWTLPA